MKTKKVKMYLGIMMIILFTINWMFLTPDKLQACTYIWSCEDKNEILHFDMQINASGYEWDMGTNHKKSYNLFTVALHLV